MKNKIIIICILILNILTAKSLTAGEIFNFDVTEIEILENGNKFIGKKGGIAKTEDGTIIKAINFDYDKINNILIAEGNVEINDVKDDIVIYSDKITYFKNKEIVFTYGNSRAIRENTNIEANNFNYDKFKNILNANGAVKIENEKENYIIYSDEIIYQKNDEKIFTKNNSKGIYNNINIISDNFNFDRNTNILNANGNVQIDDKIENYKINAKDITYFKTLDKFVSKGKTTAIIENKYNIDSSDVTLDRKFKELKSKKPSVIIDNNYNLYKLTNFIFFYEKEFLKGENIQVDTDYLNKKSDKYFFTNAFFDFINKTFVSKDTKVLPHKELFDKEREVVEGKENIFYGQNDPRIYGKSSKGNEKKIIVEKAIFTSCKKSDKCPPWSIKSDKITHDRVKQNIYYQNAVLNLYDVPVFYFPKFFHPDPSVERRSGLLQPRLNNSDILGSSINIPYFHVISPNKDLTFKPTIFDNRIYMLQNEYRQKNENSSFIADFSYIKGYQSAISGNNYSNRNSISHIFSKFDLDLALENFTNSTVKFFLEKVNNDTYLKVFDNVILVDKEFEEDLKDKNNLTSGMELSLDNEDYYFTAGITAYENLQKTNHDRYQYVFPHYNFSSSIFSNKKGNLSFKSSGRNSLSDTNNLRSTITNEIEYKTKDLYSKEGFVNNFGIYFKNLNATGKNDQYYKSSVQNELLNIYEISSSLPLIKLNEQNIDYITPKISFRINPSDMKDHSTNNRLLTTDNVFDINRLGLSNSYEAGKSLTVGVDYRKENKVDVEKFLEVKLATILRDTEENKIPKSSTANRTSSNLFGSIENSFSEFFSINYDFAIDNDLNKFEHNSIEAEFSVNNFVTKFNFLEKNGEVGDVNTLENITEYNFDDQNSIIFKTRRNRKINLTEYYDLVYEYQNDCLTAGIKYRKTYYQDRDLRPKEDLFLTITFFPLTTLDQKVEESAWRGENAIQNLFK